MSKFESKDLKECISSLAFSTEGECLAAGLIDERVLVWTMAEAGLGEEKKYEGNTLGVVDLCFNTSGSSNYIKNE